MDEPVHRQYTHGKHDHVGFWFCSKAVNMVDMPVNVYQGLGPVVTVRLHAWLEEMFSSGALALLLKGDCRHNCLPLEQLCQWHACT